MMIKQSANKSLDRRHNNRHHNKCWKLTAANIAVLIVLSFALTGCGLERDEHTVQFQQLQQPNQQNESLPVWMDVYSKSVNQEVYSPQGKSEFLP
ncbi:hypothetical protein [Paenibacillus silvae]|uniref:Uncharacterized protein n=1 Tax=Paenibacillus silvae TaxID=1325358 RepID=A0A2W6NC64_9BACL|nr:hypothetical protein [Paenibacillus silvae]PZT53594.1 hypothetical protein DN757_21645 [Paenibacillus silvae]